jgi:hypothetical protein
MQKLMGGVQGNKETCNKQVGVPTGHVDLLLALHTSVCMKEQWNECTVEVECDGDGLRICSMCKQQNWKGCGQEWVELRVT